MLKKNLPGIAWFFLVLVLICLPGDDLPHPESWMDAVYFDKWIHVALFGMLAFLFMRPVGISSSYSIPYKKTFFFKVAIATIIWGITTELIQKFFVPKRSFDLFDWSADSAGAIIAWVFAGWLYVRRKKLKVES